MSAGSAVHTPRERRGKERRTDERKRVIWPATLETSRGTLACRVSNISPGGARIRVGESVGLGERVSLIIPGLGGFDGVVAWERGGALGVQFTGRDLRPKGGRVAVSEMYRRAYVEKPLIGHGEHIARLQTPFEAPPDFSSHNHVSAAALSSEPTVLANAASRIAAPGATMPASMPTDGEASASHAEHRSDGPGSSSNERLRAAIAVIHPEINAQIDAKAAVQLTRSELGSQLAEMVAEIARRKSIPLSRPEQANVVDGILDEMLGFGPLEPLLADESVADILVNGARQVYVERRGKLELTDVAFVDDKHLLNIALRIVTKVGRRIDEMVPLVDARLADGSRVNVIIPPLALKGPMISIRKFAKQRITLAGMVANQSLTPAMALLLKVAARCRLNTLISGGTGSGKTTLLNAMSEMIDPTERILTIEDAAELQLPLPHVGSLETRPANIDGKGEITVRDLFRNALRMRPDRIIIGEIRGPEAFDMLQAMNCGHDGSLSTIHASGPREAISRLENIIGISGIEASSRALRSQIASAIDLIVQVDRARDGTRRVTSIVEVVGMDGDVITTQQLFSYQSHDESGRGAARGQFVSSRLRPYFMPKAEYYGLRHALVQAMNSPETCGIGDLVDPPAER